jgi:hypothetical protein
MSSSPNPYVTDRPSKLAMSSPELESTSSMVANIAVLDLLFVVVFDLHHLVGGGKRPTKPLDLAIAGGIECGLQLVRPTGFKELCLITF